MRSWFARHPVSFMALYTVFYLTAFHWLEVNVTVPAIWVHCQLDDVIPFCKYAIVPYFAWFAWIPFTLFYLLLRGDRSDFWRVCLCLFTGMTIALSCYVLLPTGLALRPYRVYGSDIFARLVRMLYAVDSSKNVCPFMDKKLEQQMGESGEEKDDPFKLKDLKLIFSSKVFWLVALLCVLYYSAIFPFQKYAINMLQCNLGYTAEQAGWVFFVFPLGAAAITPILGNFLDHRGKGATMLIFGALLMIACHLVFALVLPALKGTTAAVIVAYLSIILLGISFSLVPASLWPSVPKLVDNKLLGSAYAVIFWIQNIGLYAFPMIIGAALRISNPGITDPLQYNYTTPMLIFASLGVLALLFGLWLKVEDKKRGYGLELPNIQK